MKRRSTSGQRTSATDWVANQREVADVPLGYFGASTGGGAAIVAAAERPERVGAVVSRGGRPDLAGAAWRVVAPTLLIVGSLDHQVLELNRQAIAEMQAEARLVVVEGATHLFEEQGALQIVADVARDWFLRYLRPLS